MATAMRKAVEAGRAAFLAGRIPRKLYATASSPWEGMIGQELNKAILRKILMSDDRTLLGYQQIEAKGQIPETETLKQLRQLGDGGYLPLRMISVGCIKMVGVSLKMTERQLSGIEKLRNKIMP